MTPRTVLEDLHRRGIQSVLIEGGGEVLGAFLAADLFDRVEVCCAPLLIGGEGAPGPLRGGGHDGAWRRAPPRVGARRAARTSTSSSREFATVAPPSCLLA